MPKLTSRRLRLCWYLLAAMVVFASLVTEPGAQDGLLKGHLDRYWFHFLTYVVVAIIPVLAWQRRVGLKLSVGAAFLSIGLEVMRSFVAGQSVDLQGLIVNLLGVAAGILLGLNILTLRSRVGRSDQTANASQSDLS